MRKLSFLVLLLLPALIFGQPLLTQFEQSNGTESPTYPDIINWWKKLDAASPVVKMQAIGTTDAGFPLHLILVSTDKDFDIPSIKRKNKSILFINNGIHPGEPDGIDASMLLVRDIVQGKYRLPANIVLAIIPVYNIGGALNRSKNYRIDQNGPVEKGFRGNAENLDLNRDFIKADSKNALTFTTIFHYLDPDIFIDNHVSNGADYQHVITLLTTQHNKLGGTMGQYIHQQMEPAIYALMKTKGYDLVPYVNHFGDTPEKGWSAYWDSPRYSTGYAALWNTFAFMPETHMLKPYQQRVEATRALMQSFIEFAAPNSQTIIALRNQTKKQQQTQAAFPIAWKLDKNTAALITYKGYAAGHKQSDISNLPRLYYDRSQPFTAKIPFYNTYIDTLSVQKPTAYIIPQGWWRVIDRLKANKVHMQSLAKDTTIEVAVYHIDSYQSIPRPFEGHHVNYSVHISKTKELIAFRKGDYYIPLNQTANRFLIETLEPQAEDSYFAWNFFDAVLGQKEGFSDYHFEDVAAAFLATHTNVKQALEERKRTDSAFARNGAAQLDFVFKHSPYYEPAHMRYPVYSVMR